MIRWDPGEGTYQEFGISQGLPVNIAQDIFIGPQGNVWLSFLGHGLWRFDDPEWVPFIEQGAIEGTRLDAYAVSPNGVLWICTDEGLSKYDGEEWAAFQMTGGFAEGFCEYLTVDNQGNPWMQGTYGISVFHEPDDWVLYDSVDSGQQISFRNAIGAHTAPDGTVWFAYSGGHILWFDGEEWQAANIRPSAFALSTTGQPWIVRDGGLRDPDDIITYVYAAHWQFDIGGDEDPAYVIGYYWPLPFHDRMPTESMGAIFAGLNGEMWITSDDGLVRIRGYRIGLIPLEGVRYASQIRDIEITRRGEIYLALPEGISRLNGDQLLPLQAEAGLSSNYISMLAVGPDGTLWIETLNGLQSFDGATWIAYSPPSARIDDIEIAPNGDAWVAHGYGGVSRWNGNAWEQFETGSAPGYFDDNVEALHISPDGEVCLGIQELGVSCFDGSQWIGIEYSEDMITERIGTIVVDGNGDIYLTASDTQLDNAYLHWYDGVSWSSTEIQSWKSVLAVAPDGSVWIGEESGSLYSIRDGEWSIDDLASGLPIERIIDLQFGPDGSMWLGTDDGAWRFDGNEWESFLPANSLRSSYVDEIAVSADNTIWFGGLGLARFGAP